MRLLLLFAVATCGPDTGLFDEQGQSATAGATSGATAGATSGVTSAAPAGAPAPARLVYPKNGATGIARNIATLLIQVPASPGPTAKDGMWRLKAKSGADVALTPIAPVDCPPEGLCYAIAVGGTLRADTSYTLAALAPPGGAGAAATPFETVGSFTAGASADTVAPRLDSAAIESAAGCVRIRFRSDEPISGFVVFRSNDQEETVTTGFGKTVFDVSTRLVRLPAGVPAHGVIHISDPAGHSSESPALSVQLSPAVPPVVITEVLANPAGAEGTQEFVELQNQGAAPLSLEGWTLADSAGSDRLTGLLQPGAFALIVAADYSPNDSHDPPSRAGTLLLRAVGKLGQDGLSNSGEPVELRASDGTLVSRYGGWINVSAASWNGKSVHRLPAAEGCDHPGAWTQVPRAPTPGW